MSGEFVRGARTRQDPPRRDNVLPFRPRHRPAVRRLRLHPLRRLAPPFLLALVIVGGPVAVVGWIFHSPVFALTDLELDLPENGRVDQRWVRTTLDPFLRHNLPRLELAWVDRALARHPWVAATELHKELPGRLVVRVLERRAVALYRGGEELCGAPLCYLDAQGRSIAPLGAGSPAAGSPTDGMPAESFEAHDESLILVSGALPDLGSRPALELAAEIAAVAPSWAAGLSEIEVLGESDFRIWSSTLPFPLLVRAGTLESKSPYFEALRPRLVRHYENVAAVDLRFMRRIIVKPRGSDPRRQRAAVDAAGRELFKQVVFEKGVG